MSHTYHDWKNIKIKKCNHFLTKEKQTNFHMCSVALSNRHMHNNINMNI